MINEEKRIRTFEISSDKLSWFSVPVVKPKAQRSRFVFKLFSNLRDGPDFLLFPLLLEYPQCVREGGYRQWRLNKREKH